MRFPFLNLFTFCIVFAFLSCQFQAQAQDYNPSADIIYNPDVVASVYLTMSAADKKILTDSEDVQSDVYLPTKFRFVNGAIDTTLLIDCGVRLRGNTSRYSGKKSFKLDFKEFGGTKFFGYKKFNLKAEVNDPSLQRELMALRLYRVMNIPAARAHYTKLYLNNEYMGLYLNVEQIDDEFVDSRFNDDTGNLYKCAWGSNLTADNNVYDNALFELETNETINDRAKLQNFIQVLNNTPTNTLKTELEKILNVDNVIKYLALEVVLGHWDGYSYNKNNYYLYENPINNKIEIIPYDLDNTMGIDWIGRDWATRSVLDWHNHGEARPLMTRLLLVPEYKTRFIDVINQFIMQYFNENYLFPDFNKYQNLLRPYILQDTYYLSSYSADSYSNSLDMQVAGHVPYGLKPYVRARVAAAKQELGITAIHQNLSLIHVFPNPSKGYGISIKFAGNVNEFQPVVRNMYGRVVSVSDVVYQSDTIELVFHTKLTPGIYFVCSQKLVFPFIVE